MKILFIAVTALLMSLSPEPVKTVNTSEHLEPRVVARTRTEIITAPVYQGIGEYQLRSVPSVTVEDINKVLESYNSPAAGTGEVWYNLGVKWMIDPAYALAFFIHESTAGANPAWAGHKPNGTTTHNIGNLACGNYSTCYGRWRDYNSWEEGIEDWYRVINVVYIQNGYTTVHAVIPKYAPSYENNISRFVTNVTWLVDKWRKE
jgi:hypothetical protein